jgi:hypothetical protein
MSACPVDASERTENGGRDEWRVLMADSRVRGWDVAKCLAEADAWWSTADDAWALIEPRYIAIHGEDAWDALDWSATLDFIASEIVNHTGPDDDLITPWLEFHINRELES